MKRHTQWLVNHGACSAAVGWAETQDTMQSAWDNCPRADWMLWLMRAAKVQDEKLYRLFACWCVRNTPLGDGRKVWDLLTDKRRREAVKVAEKFANGAATRDELRAAAAYAAYAAVYAADADDAAYAAAYAAAGADAAYAADAAAYADAAYAYAADAAAYADAAYAAAAYAAAAADDAAAAAADADAARLVQANHLRAVVPQFIIPQ